MRARFVVPLVIAASTVVAAEPPQCSWEMVGSSGGDVRFANGRVYDIPLRRAVPIAVLYADDGTPFLMAEGADCEDCDENITLRFFALGHATLVSTGKRYSYPGSLADYESSQLVSKTRTFYGQCLSRNADSVVWFEDYLGEDRRWHSSTTALKLSVNGESLATDHAAKLSALEKLGASGACKELPGRDGTIEP
jgi:hypothetical protein